MGCHRPDAESAARVGVVAIDADGNDAGVGADVCGAGGQAGR